MNFTFIILLNIAEDIFIWTLQSSSAPLFTMHSLVQDVSQPLPVNIPFPVPVLFQAHCRQHARIISPSIHLSIYRSIYPSHPLPIFVSYQSRSIIRHFYLELEPPSLVPLCPQIRQWADLPFNIEAYLHLLFLRFDDWSCTRLCILVFWRGGDRATRIWGSWADERQFGPWTVYFQLGFEAREGLGVRKREAGMEHRTSVGVVGRSCIFPNMYRYFWCHVLLFLSHEATLSRKRSFDVVHGAWSVANIVRLEKLCLIHLLAYLMSSFRMRRYRIGSGVHQ